MKAAAASLEDLRPVNEQVAQTIAPEASGRAPRRTGRLAASLRATGTNREARISSDLVYANPIHFGWPAHNIRAHPFITETIDTRREDVANAYENAVEKEIGRIKGA